jgi:hypothetical protein
MENLLKVMKNKKAPLERWGLDTHWKSRNENIFLFYPDVNCPAFRMCGSLSIRRERKPEKIADMCFILSVLAYLSREELEFSGYCRRSLRPPAIT